jgi:MazG family protein
MTTELSSHMPSDAPENSFDRLCWIMDRLLGPGGCPWDREQTHESLKQYLIEEAYEVYEAIENEDHEHLKEELGDVALQVVFHSAMAQRDGRFGVGEVLDGISEKLVRRHPHVFGATQVDGAGQVLENWEEIKKRERKSKATDDSLVAGVPRSLPALQKAHRMQSKVRRVGFDWPDATGALGKVREEFEEVAQEVERGSDDAAPSAELIEEFGDLFFALANVARLMGVQPEEALQGACAKFAARFRHIEKRAAEEGRELEDMTLEEMDVFWDEAKKK